MMPSKGTKYYIRCIEMAKGGCIPKTRYMIYSTKNPSNGAVVVVQLAERSLPTPEIRGSNPNIGNDKFVFERNYLSIATQKRQK